MQLASQCAQLPAGAAAAEIRRKYKVMAVALHPDKCRIDGAADAFRRIVQAQQNLLKYAA
jgi:curved DNA-binding protein CbpA